MNRSHYFLSLLGDAICEECGNSWPCHAAAWGNPRAASRCAICGGDVYWYPPDDPPEAA